jgi:hypothetical protein
MRQKAGGIGTTRQAAHLKRRAEGGEPLGEGAGWMWKMRPAQPSTTFCSMMCGLTE